jgi:tRNA threonylcarbamoyl adenosine modification protein (Sua5/YciO/YrdC/YwlC family)
MAQYFEIHPENPQIRLINQAVDILQQGGVIVYPTDSAYAIACHLDDKQALDKIKRIRRLDEKHDFTLACKDLNQVSQFTKIGNDAFRLLKNLTPGPFTFIFDATKEVPRRLQHAKKRTIGIRVPDNKIAQMLIEQLGEPLLTATMIMPGEQEGMSDPYEIRERLEQELDLVIDAGVIESQPTTIIACDNNRMEIVRQGIGQAPMLE